MNHLGTFLLGLLGFAALALATERQQEIHLGRALASNATRCLRIAGWTGLFLALSIAVGSQGWAMGLVSYSGHTSLCAGLVFSALLLRERLATLRKD
jgi:hypothetical protein